jgi:hypothetical protein
VTNPDIHFELDSTDTSFGLFVIDNEVNWMHGMNDQRSADTTFSHDFIDYPMSTNMRLFITWPNDNSLPVVVPHNARGKHLFNLLNLACTNGRRIKFIFDGHCVDPTRELRHEHIGPGCRLRVVFVSSDPDPVEREAELSEALLPEFCRLEDEQFSQMEGDRWAAQTCRTILQQQMFEDDGFSDSEDSLPTVIAPEGPAPSTLALPLLRLCDETDSDDEDSDPNRGIEYVCKSTGRVMTRSTRTGWVWNR